MLDLCTFGELSWLFVLPVPHLPLSGEFVPVKSTSRLLGNDASNTALLAARQGLRSAMLATNAVHACDGLPLLQLLEGAGVDISRINTNGVSTPTTYILECSDPAERAGLIETYSFYHPPLEQLPASAFAYFDLYEEYTAERLTLIEKYAKTPTRCFINLSHSNSIKKAALLAHIPPVDALQIAGAGNIDEARMLGRHIIQVCGAVCAVITLGALGAVLVEQQGDYFVAAEAIQPVRTNGAGVAFSAGFLYALVQGATHREAATFANKYAATFCTLERNPLEVSKR